MYRKYYNPSSAEKTKNRSTFHHEEYKRHLDPSYVDQHGRRALHIIILQGTDNAQELENLIKAGCDINACDNEENQAVHLASERGYVDCVKTLVKWGANLDMLNKNNHSPMMLASRGGHSQVLKVLIKGGANVNKTNDKGEIPLHFGTAEGHVECVHILLSNKAKVNYPDKCGNSPLIWASQVGDADILKMLLDAGAKVDNTDALGRTALHYIAKQGSQTSTDLLIHSRADLDMTDQAGDTPFVCAIKSNNAPVVQALIDGGCDRCMIDGLLGTSLTLAALKGHTEIVKILINAGEEVDECGYFGLTSLICATFESSTAIVRTLLHNGADPNVLGRLCKASPMLQCILLLSPANEVPRHKILKMLIRANGDVNFRATTAGYYTPWTNGRNCLVSYAICSGYLSILRMLLLAGTTINLDEAREWLSIDDTYYFFDRQQMLEPIKEWNSNPLSLKHHSRKVIRNVLGKDIQSKIPDLEIANVLKKYIDFEDLDYIPIEMAKAVKNEDSPWRFFGPSMRPCGLSAIEGTLMHSMMMSAPPQRT